MATSSRILAIISFAEQLTRRHPPATTMADDTSRRGSLFATVFRNQTSSIPPSSTYSDGTARTIYRSKNNDTGAEFECTAPAGSKHAQMMRELCASVQGVSLPSQQQATQPQPRHQPQLLSSTSTPSQIQSESPVSQTGLIRTVSKATASNHGRKEKGSKHRNPPPKLQRADGGVTFKRIEDDTSVTYLSRSVRGEVFVAAPKGSEEAEAHERMARAQQRGMLGGERRGGEDVKVVSNSRPRAMLGWWRS